MDSKELRQKTTVELAASIAELHARIQDLRFRVATAQSKSVRELRAAKRDLARAMSVLNESTSTN